MPTWKFFTQFGGIGADCPVCGSEIEHIDDDHGEDGSMTATYECAACNLMIGYSVNDGSKSEWRDYDDSEITIELCR